MEYKTKRIVTIILVLSILMTHSMTANAITTKRKNFKSEKSFSLFNNVKEKKEEKEKTVKVDFSDVAAECHKVLSDNSFSYGTHPYDFSKETPRTTKNKTIDCSGFVSWTLYEYGKQIKDNTFKGLFGTSTSASALKDIFSVNTKYFEYIGKADKVELKKGDLLVRPGKHIEIYSHTSGTGNWKIKCWHAGNTNSIQADSTSSGVVNSSPSTYYVYRLK